MIRRKKKSDLRTRRELSEPHIKKQVSSLWFKTWLGTGCAEPSPQTADTHTHTPPARSRAGGPVGRATQRTLSELLSLCQSCLVPGICNFSHALCVPVRKWVPISSSLGFPWESNKNSQRPPLGEGRETMKELYLLLRRNTNNPHIPHSTKADKINSQSRALSLSYQTSGVWIL